MKYSNTERELLGIVFGSERLHHCIYGCTTTFDTYNEPLTSISKRIIVTASPILQRLLLRLVEYYVKIKYLRDKENLIAGGLSIGQNL